MDVKILQRCSEDFISSGDRPRVTRSTNPLLHPLSRGREYVRALTATKLQKIFAKPFISVMEGHTDSVTCMAINRSSLVGLFTGSANGDLRVWNTMKNSCIASYKAHNGFVKGVVGDNSGKFVLTCGVDGSIRRWDYQQFNLLEKNEPINTFSISSPLNGIDYSWFDDTFATAGDMLDIWNISRSDPITSYDFSAGESLISVKYNPCEECMLVSTASDNSICLFDTRANSQVKKVILRMRSNNACWNPQKPFNFTVANEDSNLYTFDIRKFDSALVVHKAFTNAVMDLDFSPIGNEFVASSFDKSIRIFGAMDSTSRDIYTTKRMQNVLCCRYSLDSKFIFSGSSDMCIRVWKANSNDIRGPISTREKKSIDYRNKIIERFKHTDEIRRIRKHHHVPKLIMKASQIKAIKKQSQRKKKINIMLHSKNTNPMVPEKKAAILNVQ